MEICVRVCESGNNNKCVPLSARQMHLGCNIRGRNNNNNEEKIHLCLRHGPFLDDHHELSEGSEGAENKNITLEANKQLLSNKFI